MILAHADSVFRVPPNESPNYKENNPLTQLLTLIERTRLAAERDVYLVEHLQYLFPIRKLELYSPAAPHTDVLDAKAQDNKNDFQKQNVRSFLLADTQLSRGYVAVANEIVPFLRLSYRGGPDTPLSRAANNRLGAGIKLYVRVAGIDGGNLIDVRYNEESDRYEVELWGTGRGDLRALLDAKGRASVERGLIQSRPDLVRGSLGDFSRETLGERYVVEAAPLHAMHPLLPLHVELAWTDREARVWDSNEGKNHHYEFNMIVRGWEGFLAAGMSANPHGGIGFLEYRNLMSNYFQYANRPELGRQLETWNFNAFGNKDHGSVYERFMAVDYMDLHILKGASGIGLHRHRDNQEVFLMMQGQGFMVVGDWAEFPNRERCFEVRTLRAGHFAMLKGGNLHGLMNPSDEDLQLFMFGGYD
jgi:mannose-6-phosphate isomerase-like protein (cupin superfamily)